MCAVIEHDTIALNTARITCMYNILTGKESDSARGLSEAMLVFDDLHLDDDPHLTPYPVEGIKDGKPAIQCVGRAAVS